MMAGPKPGGDKEAMMNAFKSAKEEHGAGDEDESLDGPNIEEEEPMAPDAGPPGVDAQEVSAKVDHLVNLLLHKGILAPGDMIAIPSFGMPGAQPDTNASMPAPPGGGGMPPGGGMPF